MAQLSLIELSQKDCIQYLEKIRWKNWPTCPYCGSGRATKYKTEHRYRCHGCFTSYSITVGTLFHKTHTSLPQWFRAIWILSITPTNVSVRQLALELSVHKNTAAAIKRRIQTAQGRDLELIGKINAFLNP